MMIDDVHAVQFVVVATVGSSSVTASKVINIDNTGPLVTLTVSPTLAAPFLIDNVATFTVSSTYVSGPTISVIYYYLDLATTSSLLGTSSTPPYSVSFSATSLALYTLVTVRAVTQSATGAQQVITKTGIVTMPNMAPTAIAISAVTSCSGAPCIPETAPPGQIVGSLSASDPNAGDTFTYAVVSSAPFSVVGSSLVVSAGATFSYYVQNTFTFNLRVTDQGGLTYTASFTVYITRVNLPPTAIYLSASTVSEAASVNSLVGTFSVTCRDSSSFTMLLTNSGSGSFYVSGMGLYVAKSMNWNVAPTVTITARATDSNGLSYATNFAITVNWVNKPPTLITLSSTSVLERQAPGVVVGSLSTSDPDPSQSFTYSMVNSGSGQFAISGTSLVTAKMLYYLAGAAITISIKSTDNGAPPPSVGGSAQAALSYTQTFTITVLISPQPPAVFDTVLSVPENTLFGAIIGAVTNTNEDNIPLNFTINTALSDATSYTNSMTKGCYTLQPGYAFWRMQLCSGTIFVNAVRLAVAAVCSRNILTDV